MLGKLLQMEAPKNHQPLFFISYYDGCLLEKSPVEGLLQGIKQLGALHFKGYHHFPYESTNHLSTKL